MHTTKDQRLFGEHRQLLFKPLQRAVAFHVGEPNVHSWMLVCLPQIKPTAIILSSYQHTLMNHSSDIYIFARSGSSSSSRGLKGLKQSECQLLIIKDRNEYWNQHWNLRSKERIDDELICHQCHQFILVTLNYKYSIVYLWR